MQTKVLIFDFDGTLSISNANCWSRIWKAINKLDLDKMYYNMFNENKITYSEWLNLCVKAFIDNGVDKAFIDNIASKIQLLKHVREVFEWLKDKNIKIYVLSGGIKNLIDYSLKDYLSFVEEVDAAEFVFDGNNLIGYIDTTFNPENKQEYIRDLIIKNNLNPNSVLFVGNGKNDETSKLVGVKTLCLNADDTDHKNKKIWDNYVFTDDLCDIQKFID